MNKDEYKKLKDKLCSNDSRYDETKLIEKLMLEKLMLENLQKGGAQNGLCQRISTGIRSGQNLR